MMRHIRNVAVAAFALLAAASMLFAGTPEGGAAKGEAAKPSGAAAAAPAAKSKAQKKKCPYTTQECLNHMAARMRASGWIGIEYDMDDDTGVSTVKKVIPGSPAEKAGFQVGDVLFALNGVEIRPDNGKALEKVRKEWKPGQKVQYVLKRDGRTRTVEVVLGEWPADLLARYIGEHMLEHAEADATAANAPPK